MLGHPRTTICALVLSIIAVAALSVALAQTDSTVSTEVRINARELEDGRVEFAIQQREGSGWGERVLAQRRYFPAEVGHSRWLVSSPYEVSIDVELGEYATDQASPPGHSPDEDRAAFGVEASGLLADGRISYWHGDAGVNGLRTVLVVHGDTNNSLYEEGRLYFVCDHDVRSLWVSVDAGVYIGGEWHGAGLNDHDGITLAAFGTIAQQEWERRGFVTYDDDAQIGNPDATTFFLDALSERWVSVSLPQYSSSITATFDLEGAFDTPVQWLIFGCNRVTRGE